ncbi:unnamed protein product [Pieris macdunnoughi]|uniref:Uncharacterized protein n=1 Tax=Pieris macdunnoughi TaxID=345717 RepID=A0A821TLW5_9NEOP|nr:unnamed protein product [Pieris macdunnoughi]
MESQVSNNIRNQPLHGGDPRELTLDVIVCMGAISASLLNRSRESEDITRPAGKDGGGRRCALPINSVGSSISTTIKKLKIRRKWSTDEIEKLMFCCAWIPTSNYFTPEHDLRLQL